MNEYLRQVEKELRLPRRKRQEVLRDLREIFESAREHGESEADVVERLGSAAVCRRRFRAAVRKAPVRSCAAVCFSGAGCRFCGSPEVLFPACKGETDLSKLPKSRPPQSYRSSRPVHNAASSKSVTGRTHSKPPCGVSRKGGAFLYLGSPRDATRRSTLQQLGGRYMELSLLWR